MPKRDDAGRGQTTRRHYRRLLRLFFSPEIVDAEGDEMESTFLRLLQLEAERRGTLGVVRVWLGALADGVRHGWLGRRGGVSGIVSRTGTGRGGWVTMDAIFNDLRHALRGFVRAPAFTVTAIGTLALGIGASAAAFAVIEAVLLRPLPYPDEHELVVIGLSAPGINVQEMASAPFLHFTYVEQNRAFQDVGVWRGHTVTVTGDGQAHRVPATTVSVEVLPLLAVEPVAGRLFTSDDMSPDATPTALLSYGYWQRHLGGEASALGRAIVVDGQARTVVGVLPESFRFIDRDVDLFVPYQFDRARAWLGGFGFQSLARLGSGVTLAAASADVARMIRIAIATTPPPDGASREGWAARLDLQPRLRPLREDVVDGMGRTLWLVMGAVLLVLLIALANVANLLLLRGEVRRLEWGVRAALGAGRRRILRGLAIEGAALGAAAGAAGLVLAYFALPAVVLIAPEVLPRNQGIALGLGVMGWGVLISGATGAFLALLPALRMDSPEGTGALVGGGRSATMSKGRRGAMGGLVVIQVALSIVLLIGSGLMARTYRALTAVDPGFDLPAQIQTARISIPESMPDGEQAARTQMEILERIRAIPGVQSAGLASTAPMEPTANANEGLLIEGREYSDRAAPTLRRFEFISPGYFETLGTDLIAGRALTVEDVETRRPVALVSETLALQEWQTSQAAIGRRLRSSEAEPWREVIGVVQDIYDDGPQVSPPATVYFPTAMREFWGDETFVWRETSLVARAAAAGTEPFLEAFHRAVWDVDSDLPLTSVGLLSDLEERTLARHSLVLTLLAAAGAIAFFLGMVGLYGVLAYAASQQRREIGLRIALGAEPALLRRSLVLRGIALASMGVVSGILIASYASRFLSSFLFQTSTIDVATYVAVSVVLIATAAVASYQPAKMATRVSLMVAMRPES